MMTLAAESLVRIIQYISQTKPFLRELLCYCFRLYWYLPPAMHRPGRENVILKCTGNLAEGLVNPTGFYSQTLPSYLLTLVSGPPSDSIAFHVAVPYFLEPMG